MNNKIFSMQINNRGIVQSIMLNNDKHSMNWVVSEEYLKQIGYKSEDKLFGNFDICVDGKTYNNSNAIVKIDKEESITNILFDFDNFYIKMIYDLSLTQDEVLWKIVFGNKTNENINITNFGIWISFSYIMFRDKNVLKNINNSATFYPSVSTNYSKVAIMRRSNKDDSLGFYQKHGRTVSIGSFCDYSNLFFENVSPSLDGVIFNKLMLVYSDKSYNPNDWIYKKDSLIVNAKSDSEWVYAINKVADKNDFYNKSINHGHSIINFSPLGIINKPYTFTINTANGKTIQKIRVIYKQGDNIQENTMPFNLLSNVNKQTISTEFNSVGEHKIVIDFIDNTEDFFIINIMDDISKVISERSSYICNTLYNKETHVFEPLSNQGESIGKLNLVLKKNLFGSQDISEVKKVENSAVYYVRNKWFEGGDFTKPKKLYGDNDFYRCWDFDYIAHLYYLLSQFDDTVLSLNSSKDYLNWAIDVFNLRVNPDLHDNERGKKEAQMLGGYFLYINGLLDTIKSRGFSDKYEEFSKLWKMVVERIDDKSDTYTSAITEHFYDNAGFASAAGALSEAGFLTGAKRYGELILGNIGYSNDFRSQNPDRWWEALSFMTHSLWGGITSAASFKAFNLLKEYEYLDASYRSIVAVLYCYDTNSTATKPLNKGQAASTYSVANPHFNRLDLSCNRFGQATFFRDGGIFTKLFSSEDESPDWDMGEELVAYIDGFGQNTYYHFLNDSLEVINGTFKKTENGYQIISFAPYIKNFILINRDMSQKITNANNKNILEIKY